MGGKSSLRLMILWLCSLTLAGGVAYFLGGCSTEENSSRQQGDPKRWYSEEQIETGEAIYVANCIACHLENAKGTADWKKMREDGSYPPPPLDGTAHAWHHSIEVLRKTIQEGGAAYGGRMPPFEGVLNEEDQLAVIAYFQSFWSDEIYLRWEDITQ